MSGAEAVSTLPHGAASGAAEAIHVENLHKKFGELHVLKGVSLSARDGEVIASISASGPSYRFTEERMHELAPALLKGAEEISHRMGYLG